MRIEWAMVALVVGITVPPVLAHDEGQAGHKAKAAVIAEQKPFGIAGDPKRISRTIKMDMSDEMRFQPALLKVKRGDTVRFVLRNRGKIMHEMVIGTMAELTEHAALMRRFPEMEHDEPHMAHVQPGKTEEIVWNFNRSGEFNYACLIAGHFEGGMVGKVIVK